ncbi:chromate transporter [Inhella inkyongensis]|uniref:Chromate transporter n=1 Tax=Inhella inkyongensis TaxID=392593 RepID=A0A840S1R8_9BURK|nr:chromate efflux transporter [Inhella inkyongensis]MBB5205097.1 chromate transporter [Inhella inkyongensis]
MRTPTRAQALRFWAWLGLVSFGGPAAQIALMHSELVERRRWVDEARFQHALGYCMLLPGPEAQQLATYLGWMLHGRAMGIAAGLLFILPAWGLMLGLGWLYMAQGQQPWMQGVLAGLKPAVLALVVWALWRMGRKSLQHRLWLFVALESLVLLRLGLPFPLILLLAAALGAVAAHRGWGALPKAVAVDTSRSPAPSGTVGVLGLGVLLWALPMGLLVAWQGLQGFFPQLAGFFTQAALLTFGGAYAVLPFVAQAVVQQQGWITTAQLMDGLALGETTPGPLVIVLVFIGFVAAWQQTGADPLVWGLLGGAVAGFFTFLPSFVFILVGAPWVERSRQLPVLAGPLRAIGAAVVGVMADLALFLGQHTLKPQGHWDAAALGLAVLCGLALWRWPRRAVWVVLGAALVGAVLHESPGVAVAPAAHLVEALAGGQHL